jgi:hypothetical protein
MAKAAQQLVLQILKEECMALDERYPGYRVEAVQRLGTILGHERQKRQSLQKDITDELQHFGDHLGKNLKPDGG